MMKQDIWTFVLFWLIPLTTGQDVTVTCVNSSDCMLPCTSPYRDIIHWYKEGKENSVHTFYDRADHLEYQDKDFKGRTSLFIDQISQGNVSLLLRTRWIEDEGRYKCYTATSTENKEQFVFLKVKVPVKSVDIKTTSDGISCSTENVYPKPKVSWYRDGKPEDKFHSNQHNESNQHNKHLFSVSSVLPQAVKENITYGCSISLGDETQSYTASLRKENVVICPGKDATIHCTVDEENNGKSIITLTFGEFSINLNYSQMSQLHYTTEQWRGKTLQLAHDGTITIHNLENEDAGIYTCVRVTAQSKQVVLTSVQISSANRHTLVVVVTIAVIIAITVVIAAAICWQKCRNRDPQEVQEEYNQPLKKLVDGRRQ
ncbi:HERV-H LTR-associating protein 2 [Neoarius graeffei]|uniref:HERV-H LTR-associating protein 2 n=1 Tax=Neoarius graeffei TaxID=443677 RepID=UPI00298CD601|nr:HERV-H LTR-associating protein 2 [Neoarius graeffei]